MKQTNTIVIIMVALLTMVSGSPEKNTEYHIKGTIKGIANGQVKLMRYIDSNRTTLAIDSVNVIDGTFELKGKVTNPEMMSLSFTPNNWSLSLFMENNNILVEADTTEAEHYDYSAYGGVKGARIKKYTVKGSVSHEQYLSYENDAQNKQYTETFSAIHKRYEKASDKEKEVIRLETDSLRPLYTKWQEAWIENFIEIHPSSPVGAFLFRNYYELNRDISLQKMASTLALFKGEALASAYYVQLNDALQQRLVLSPGHVAPDFKALRSDSTEFSLYSTRGKLVLIDFWASWCIPCRQSIPHWREVYAKYHKKGLEIVGVTNDSNWKSWKKALEQEKMPWIQVADDFPIKNRPSRIGTQYMAPYLPTYVLLDIDGKIILHNGSKEEITKEIEKRLN